jgi:putative hydrolase of the HAD superfamily
MDNIDSVLSGLKKYNKCILTKGDLTVQTKRAIDCHILPYFRQIFVVGVKDVHAVVSISRFFHVNPPDMAVIGNSIPVDVIPILEAGGFALHIPYGYYDHETPPNHTPEDYDWVYDHERYFKLESIDKVPEYIKKIEEL